MSCYLRILANPILRSLKSQNSRLFCAPRTPHHVPWSRQYPARSTCRAISAFKSPMRATAEDLFKPTRYKFVSNETREVASRSVQFDVTCLARRAAIAVNSKDCVKITKGNDGSYSRILVLEMDDGKEVVVKIPTKNAGRSHYSTASEVATMTFFRETLNMPVPRVVAWSSEPDDVGAEYIIMEKVPGLPLSDVWSSMGTESKFQLIKNFVAILRSWTSITFKKYGSLYFAKDISSPCKNQDPLYVTAEGREVADSRYVVGPSIGRGWFDNERDQLEIDRGPWATALQYKRALGYRDLDALDRLSDLPTPWIGLYGPGTYIPNRPRKRQALQCYLKLIRYLLPTDASLGAATLWHPDVHAENIFVNPQNPSEITGIIDWQSAEVAPLFEYASQPGFLDHEGPPAAGLERPKHPSDDLKGQARVDAERLWLSQTLEVYYRRAVQKFIPQLDRVRTFRDTDAENLLLLARHILVEGECHYLVAVHSLCTEPQWSQVPAVQAARSASKGEDQQLPCPIKFTEDEVAAIYKDADDAIKAMDAMNEVKGMLGHYFPDRGAVLPENYAKTKMMLRSAKNKIVDKYAQTERDREEWEKRWPFDD